MLALLTAVVLAVHPPACPAERRSARHQAPKRVFAKGHPCPSTGEPTASCPGYIVDHVCPLVCCGPDSAANMQWQTTAEAKAKDRWERDCSSCPTAGK